MTAEMSEVIAGGFSASSEAGARRPLPQDNVMAGLGCLAATQRSMLLANVQCSSHHHADGRTENMAEHNFGLALLSAEIASQTNDVDPGHAAVLAVVNQLETVEFSASPYGSVAPLPSHILELAAELRDQSSDEAQIVRSVDQRWRAGLLPESLAGMQRRISEMSGIERIPRFTPERRENNAEHSYMHTLVAMELSRHYHPDSDIGRLVLYCLGHDLIETVTGDIPTMIIDDASLASKCATEQAHLPELLDTLPPYIRQMVEEYEAQVGFDVRLVRLMDKLLPTCVDIIGPGELVVSSNFGIYTRSALQAVCDSLNVRYKSMFGEPKFDTVHAVHDQLQSIQVAQMPVTRLSIASDAGVY